MRDQLVTPDHAAHQICSHVAELRNDDEIKAIKLSGHQPGTRAGQQVDYLRHEIEKPEHVKQPKERVSHRLKWFVFTKTRKHLAGEDCQQEKKHQCYFEIIGV